MSYEPTQANRQRRAIGDSRGKTTARANNRELYRIHSENWPNLARTVIIRGRAFRANNPAQVPTYYSTASTAACARVGRGDKKDSLVTRFPTTTTTSSRASEQAGERCGWSAPLSRVLYEPNTRDMTTTTMRTRRVHTKLGVLVRSLR